MSVVWQRQERVAPPSAYGMLGLGPSDPEVVGEGGKGLQVEVSKSAGGEKAVEGGGHRGCSGVSGGDIGWQVAVGGESVQGGEGGRGRRVRVKRAARGRPRLFVLRAFRGGGNACGQAFCTGNCTGSFFLFLFLFL